MSDKELATYCGEDLPAGMTGDEPRFQTGDPDPVVWFECINGSCGYQFYVPIRDKNKVYPCPYCNSGTRIFKE